MGVTEGQLFQITVVAVLATVLFFGAYSLPQKVAATVLIVMIPFEPIATQYASVNVVLTWIVFVAMLMRRGEIRLPLMPHILVVLFIYLVSMGVQEPSTYLQHGIYMFNLLTAALMLWIAYDLTRRFDSLHKIMLVFVVMNVLVAIYCAIQMTAEVGDKYAFLGIEEMTMMPVVKDNRLTGPFGGPGTIAEYFVVMAYLVLHQILTTKNAMYRRFLVLLLLFNVFLLIATGNRGGFLTLLGAAVLYLWLFRRVLGTGRTLGLAVGGVGLLAVSAALAINFTRFDVLFDRLLETEIEEGIPDTRQNVWPIAWQEIKTQPLLGHGPRLRFVGEEEGTIYTDHKYIQYPHNLYLFLLFTVGIVGTVAFLTLMVTPLYRCWRTSRLPNVDLETRTFAMTGVVIMVAIFVDQLKIEFMRIALTDYWHFIFALIGVLVAVCDQAKVSARNPQQNSWVESPGRGMVDS